MSRNAHPGLSIETLESRQLLAADLLSLDNVATDTPPNADYFVADSFSFAVEREMKESGEKGGTADINIGIGELQECTISKSMDAASPNLAQHAINGNSLGTAEIDFVETAGTSQEPEMYLTYKLDRAFVKSWSTSGDADDRPTEEVAFYYNKIAFSYRSSSDGNGGLITLAPVGNDLLSEPSANGYDTKDFFVADSFSFGVEREMKESGEKGGTADINIGVGELQECTISKSMDAADANVTGVAEIDSVELAETDDGPVLYLKYKLERAYVTSWSTSGDAHDRPTEEVAFSYDRIEFSSADEESDADVIANDLAQALNQPTAVQESQVDEYFSERSS